MAKDMYESAMIASFKGFLPKTEKQKIKGRRAQMGNAVVGGMSASMLTALRDQTKKSYDKDIKAETDPASKLALQLEKRKALKPYNRMIQHVADLTDPIE